MRIVAGTLKGRTIASPKTSRTHPMSEQVRGALFNALGDIKGLTFLDAFAGSGAIGLEAISRGAKSVTFIESDRVAQSVISENSQALGVYGHCKLIKASLAAWLSTSHSEFDVVAADPPYHDLQVATIANLQACLSPDGTLVLSWPGKAVPPEIDDLTIVLNRHYGDAQLVFYQSVN